MNTLQTIFLAHHNLEQNILLIFHGRGNRWLRDMSAQIIFSNRSYSQMKRICSLRELGINASGKIIWLVQVKMAYLIASDNDIKL